jgi:hypothetical protein
MTNASIYKNHLSFGPLIAAAEIGFLKTVVNTRFDQLWLLGYVYIASKKVAKSVSGNSGRGIVAV